MNPIVIIQENIDVLLAKKYISEQDLDFIVRLGAILQDQTNSLSITVSDFMTVEEIANHLEMDNQEIEEKLRVLVKKGILFEFISRAMMHEYDPLTSKRPLFMNPEIMYKGDPQMIDATLCTLANHFNKIQKKVKLPFKLFLAPDMEYGGIFPADWIEHFLSKIQYEVNN